MFRPLHCFPLLLLTFSSQTSFRSYLRALSDPREEMAQKFNAAGRRVTAKAVNVTDLISKITLGGTAEIQADILKEVAATEHRFNEEWLEKKKGF